ncbi:MAG: ribulose-phosphate 3-epimerase [Planctomycetota bacterium]|nr:ribulose-phosphate 3-epimerase [Planctomycetota bacterium]
MASQRLLIAPSLLAADFSRLRDEIQTVEAAGADWFHVDIMDGHFVPNLTMGPFIVEAIRKLTKLPLDCHLMIEYPEQYAEAFVKAGADWISVHPEPPGDARKALEIARRAGARPSLAINPPTTVQSVQSFRGEIEMLLIMTIFPGFGGQKLMIECLPKYAQAREVFGPDVLLEIDGGVTIENGGEVRAAGAEVIVAGTAIFHAPDPAAAMRALRKA